jgi:phosphoribosylpyrophosphate synthetase
VQSFVESLTILLPYFPVGTMERVDHEGVVATANTYGILLSNLPRAGKPSRLMIYDIHTLQNRFYFHDAVTPSLHSTIPLLIDKLKAYPKIKSVAFPDEGAAKRFGHVFAAAGYSAIICGKVRRGNERIVTIHDGIHDAPGNAVCIVDDLVQTGGTLAKCATALKEAGASHVYAFVAHAVFPHDSWRAFCRGGALDCFERFWTTNSTMVSMDLPKDDVFETLDLLPQFVRDLDGYYV